MRTWLDLDDARDNVSVILLWERPDGSRLEVQGYLRRDAEGRLATNVDIQGRPLGWHPYR